MEDEKDKSAENTAEIENPAAKAEEILKPLVKTAAAKPGVEHAAPPDILIDN